MSTQALLAHWKKRPFLDSLLVFSFSFIVFYLKIPEYLPIRSDTITPLLMARDCLSGLGCFLKVSTFDALPIGGFHHGAMFNHFMALIQYLGGSLHAFSIFMVFCTSLSVSLLFSLGRLLGGRYAGFMAALLLLFYWRVIQPIGHDLIYNPSLIPLPATLFLFASCLYIHKPNWPHLIIAAFALSLGMQVHGGFPMHIPGFIYIIVVAPAPRRWLRGFVGTALVILPILIASAPILLKLPSWDALGPMLPVPIKVAVLLVVSSVAAILFLGIKLRNRVAPVILMIILTQLPLQLLHLILRPGVRRYSHSVKPAMALLLVGLGLLLWRRFPRIRSVFNLTNRIIAFSLIALSLITFSIVTHVTLSNSRFLKAQHVFFMTESEEAAQLLSAKPGRTYRDVFRHLRGGGSFYNLLNGLAYTYPKSKNPLSEEGRSLEAHDLAVFRITSNRIPSKLPAGWKVLGQRRKHALLVYQYRPYLNWDSFDFCFMSLKKPLTCRWRRTDYENRLITHPLDRGLWTARECPALRAFENNWPSCPFSLFIRVPLEIPAGGSSRRIVVPRHGLLRKCGGQIISISGVAHQGKLPAPSATLLSARQKISGFITLGWDFCNQTCPINDPRLPPPVLEFDDKGYSLYRNTPDYEMPPALTLSAQPRRLAPRNSPRLPPPAKRYSKQLLAPLWYVIILSILIILGILLSIRILTRRRGTL